MALLHSLHLSTTTPFQTLSTLSSSSAYRPSSASLPVSSSAVSLSTVSSIPTIHLIKSLKIHSFHCHCSSSSSASATSVAELEDVREEEEEVVASPGGSRLIAQNVPWSCSAEDVRALFQKYGTVVDVELSMHNKTRNRGLAFVTMGSPDEALAALNNLEGFEYDGRILKINYANSLKKKPRSPSSAKAVSPYNLFVSNLSYEVRAKDLREFFDSEGGKVVSAEVIFHENPRRASGYGFVSFGSKEAAEAALTAFDGKMFLDRPIRVARSKRFAKQASPPVKNESPISSDTGAAASS